MNAKMQCTATSGCAGEIEDGFCNVCGMEPLSAAPAANPAAAAVVTGRTDSTASHGSRSTASGTALSGLSRGSSTSRRGKVDSRSLSSRKHLGLGLITLGTLPKADPEKAVMAVPEVPVRISPS